MHRLAGAYSVKRGVVCKVIPVFSDVGLCINSFIWFAAALEISDSLNSFNTFSRWKTQWHQGLIAFDVSGYRIRRRVFRGFAVWMQGLACGFAGASVSGFGGLGRLLIEADGGSAAARGRGYRVAGYLRVLRPGCARPPPLPAVSGHPAPSARTHLPTLTGRRAHIDGAVVIERRGGLVCSAQVKEEPARLRQQVRGRGTRSRTRQPAPTRLRPCLHAGISVAPRSRLT